MKTLLILLITSLNVFAQIDSTKTKTIFGSGKSNALKKINHLGIYFAPEVQYGSLASEYRSFTGGSAMLVFNKKWAIGFAGYMSDGHKFNTSLSSNKSLGINAGFGGIKLEYAPKVTSIIHVSFPLLIGGGIASIDSMNRTKHYFGKRRNFNNGYRHRYMKEDYVKREHEGGSNFFVLQPGVNIEANVFKFAKVFVGASYRIAAGVNAKSTQSVVGNALPKPTASQLSGLSVNAGLKIGVFDYQLGKHKGRKYFGNRKHKNKSNN